MERVVGPRERWTSLLGLALVGALAPAAVAADPAAEAPAPWLSEVRGGVLAHDVGGLWSGEHVEHGFDLNGELIFRRGALPLGPGSLRPHVGATWNTRGYTSKLYAGVCLRFEADSGAFLELGLGAAVHDGERETDDRDEKQLGSRVLFRIPIEAGLAFGERHSLSILFDHVSNAGLADENEGLDTLGLRYGLRF
jgi:hypothetical protein